MPTTNSDKVLFPDDIIPLEGVLGVISVLRQPYRNQAKGINCITGFSIKDNTEGSAGNWFQLRSLPADFECLKTLSSLQNLKYPLSIEVMYEFLDEYILLNPSTKTIPTFLTNETLKLDKKQRIYLYKIEVKELLRLFLLKKVELLDKERRILDEKIDVKQLEESETVFFAREEGLKYLRRKGYLTKARLLNASWQEIVQEPEIIDSHVGKIGCCFGYPRMLIDYGLEYYYNWLRVQRPRNQTGSGSALLFSNVGESPITNLGKADIPLTSSNAQDEPSLEVYMQDSEVCDLNLKQRRNQTNARDGQIVRSLTRDLENGSTGSVQPEDIVPNRHAIEKDMTLVGMSDVCAITGYGRSSIYSFVKKESEYFDPAFPRSQLINGENKWYKSEVDDWVKLNMKRNPAI